MSKRTILLVATLSALIALGTLISLYPSHSLAALTVEEVARQELPRMLDRIRSDYQGYGFRDEQELNIATLGRPYQVYGLSPNAVQAYRPDQPVSAILFEEQWWEFPVLIDGEARGLLTLAQMNGQWKAVEFGSLPLSVRITQLQQKLAHTDVRVKLVKVPHIYGTFALLEQGQNEQLVHLGSYPGVFKTIDREELTAYAASKLMPEIREAIAQVKAAEKSKP
ncbi:MAG TPA: hypothetical protein VFZ66_28760 [Herpetosiphonaceae bacterium]